jgi:cytochrome c
MSRFPEFTALVALASALIVTPAAADGNVGNGKNVFKRCIACHAVGAGARHKIGPHLNDLFGRVVGSSDGYAYSKAMKDAGAAKMVWSAETLDTYLANPRTFIKGTRMVFAGLPKQNERADLIAYLRSYDQPAVGPQAAPAAPKPTAPPAVKSLAPDKPKTVVATAPIPPAAASALPKHGVFHLGRPATAAEIAAWDIDVRPDGLGLPKGKGTVAQGEAVYTERCASCHGDFGEGKDRWPIVAGGFDTLKAERPEKTIGSYWPYLSTVFDYIRRAMPFGDARSLTDDEVYALTAYLLQLNDIVSDPNFELSSENFTKTRLPNEENFYDDDRVAEPFYAKKGEPCMRNCNPAPAKVIMRARVLDVTPDGEKGDKRGGSVD